MAGLKQKLVEGEEQIRNLKKQTQVQDELQKQLADALKTNTEMKREVLDVMASRAEIEQALAVYNARLATMRTNISALTEQAGVIKQVRADLEKEKQAQAAALKQLDKEKNRIEAATKDRKALQADSAELEKQVVQESARQKAVEQLRDNLVQAKQARASAEVQLAGAGESQKIVQKETADLQRKIKDLERRLDEQAGQAKELKNLQADLSKAQKAREEVAAEVAGKTKALADAGKEQDALKSRLAEMEKQCAAKQEQVKALARAQVDLKQEQELRKQLDKSKTEMAAREKEHAAQTSDMKDRLQAATDKNAALDKDLARRAQAAKAPAVESSAGRSETESVAEAEKRIIAQARGEAPSDAIESAQGAEQAKSAGAGGLFLGGSKASRHYQAGIQKWDAGDIDGAISEFKKAISLDSSLAGAYYNIALGYAKQGDSEEACDYAYKAGKIYLKNKNSKQAVRMVVFIKKIDPSSSLIEKLREEIAENKP